MSIIDHAEKEFALLDTDEIDYGDMIPKAALEVLQTIAKQGHSGSSVMMLLHVLTKLIPYGVLSPLTGEDDEWMEIADGKFQNTRRSSVFRCPEEGDYDIEGCLLELPDGTQVSEKLPVTFPYTPSDEPKIIKVNETGDILPQPLEVIIRVHAASAAGQCKNVEVDCIPTAQNPADAAEGEELNDCQTMQFWVASKIYRELQVLTEMMQGKPEEAARAMPQQSIKMGEIHVDDAAPAEPEPHDPEEN